MYAMSAPHDQFAHYNGGYPVDGNEAAADYSYQHDSTGYYYHTSQHHQQPPQMHGSGYAGYDEPTATMMMMSSIGAYQQQCYVRAMGDGGLPHHAHQQHDADHYPAARAAYGAGPALGPAPCVVCGVQQVPFHGAACTRRCRWFADGCCPQCGRGRASAATAFCSLGCAGEARQANWCVGCGVRQVIHGGTSCSAPHCAAVVARLAARFANTTTASAGGPAVSAGGRGGPRSAFGGVTTGRRGSLNSSHGSAASNSNATSSSSMPSATAGGKRRFEPHAVLAPNDKVASSVRQQLGSDLARRVAAVVKVGGASEARKAYTAYRNRVEGELNESCGIGAPKYGHGGEGNEHRRYLVLTSECGAAVAGSGAEPTFCGSANCGVCCFLEHGAAALLSRTHEGESASAAAAPGYRAYSTASSAATAAASLATRPSAALVVARVTIGAPSFAPLPPQQNASSSSSTLERTHCVVDRRDTYDIATLPADVACVDPLFVVVLRGQQQQQ